MVAVVDVRWYIDGRSGRDAFRDGHIPGAQWLDMDRDLSGPPVPGTGRHPLPDAAAFVATLAEAGIGERTPVVAYDDAGGSLAARLWWMLDALGRPAAVLDGGLAAWTGPLEVGGLADVGGPSEAGGLPEAGRAEGGAAPDGARPSAQPSRPVQWPRHSAVGTDEVDGLRRHPGVVLLDARSGARYRGEADPIDSRPGHIPGAVSAPWAANLDPATGTFADLGRLRDRYRALGVDGTGPVVASCGSGITACHDILALRLAGVADTRLYVGSWSAWSSDPDRPAVTGPHPG